MTIQPETLGDICRRRREELGMSQSELSRVSGVPITTIFNLEHGKCLPRLDTAITVAAALRLSVEQLSGAAKMPRSRVDLSTLGLRIAQLREAQNLPMRRLAQMAGISDAGLFWIENGTSMPRIDTLLYLASALGTTVGALIGEV